MKTVLIVILIVVGLAFYLGWVKVTSRSDSGKANVTLSVDKDKLKADTDKAVEKVQDLGNEAAQKIAATTQKARD